MSKDIFLTNNLTNKKEKFIPIDKSKLECMFVVQLFMMIHILVMLDQ